MGTLLRLPVDEAAFARLVQRERQANMAAERAEAVQNARAVLRSPKRHSDQILRDACAVLQAWGDGTDYLTADAMVFALNRRDRLRANEAHSLHLAGLLNPVDPRHRDRSDLIDSWKASARRAEADETPVRIALREPSRGTIRAGLVDMAVLLAFGAAVLVVVYVGGSM